MNQSYSTGITTILNFKKIEGKRIVSNDFRFLNFELTPVNQGEQATDLLEMLIVTKVPSASGNLGEYDHQFG